MSQIYMCIKSIILCFQNLTFDKFIAPKKHQSALPSEKNELEKSDFFENNKNRALPQRENLFEDPILKIAP